MVSEYSVASVFVVLQRERSLSYPRSVEFDDTGSILSSRLLLGLSIDDGDVA